MVLKIACDGGAKNNGSINAKGRIGIYFGKDDPRNTSKRLSSKIIPHTNQKSELISIKYCLKLIEDVNDNIIIYSDSLYSINCITKWIISWKKTNFKNNTIKNMEIIKKIDELLIKRNKLYPDKTIKFIHVRGHQKKPNNDKESEEYIMWEMNYYADLLTQ